MASLVKYKLNFVQLMSLCVHVCIDRQETSVALSNQETIVTVNKGNSESWWAVTFQT